MKTILRAAVTILFLAVLSTAALLSLRLSQRDGQFKATQAGFNLLIQLHAATLDQGFFSWTKLKDLVAHHEVSEAELLLQDVYATYPFIKETILLPRDKPVSAYEIVGSNTTLQLSFSLKDDLGNYPLPGWVGVVSIDAQKLLDAYNPENKLVIVANGERELGYSIHVNFSEPVLRWLDYIVILLFASGIGFPLSQLLERRHNFFYETKGLESIIFLFEQNEYMSANHSRRVAAISYFIGQKMGYRGRKLRNLYTAALLHDIGKISIPTHILTKEGPLTEEERAIIERHPTISARILENFRELAHLRKIVLSHHERMDGSGYPSKMKGDEIPEQSRIITIADVFEALTGKRPYRESVAPGKAFAILRKMPLDHLIVDVLESHYAERREFKNPKWVLSFTMNEID